MQENDKIKVGISIGDLNGIGCEVVLKTFEDVRMLDFCTPVIFASNKTISFQKNALNLEINYHGIQEPNMALEGKINVVNVWKEVTAPINKDNIQAEDFKFPGHTDYLAKELEGESLMFMVTDSLKIGLLTDHIAIKDVASAISARLIRNKISIIEKSLVMDFGIRKPKIALLGLNPHSGDNGVIGKEDDEIFKPVVRERMEIGHLVYGPYSADSFFGSQSYKNFDAVLAAYHDQGLIPFKTLSFGNGVNFTAGLNKVRTSPDHGTAYEIAGKGIADHSSFREAVFTALSIYKNRLEYQELTKDPLKKQRSKF